MRFRYRNVAALVAVLTAVLALLAGPIAAASPAAQTDAAPVPLEPRLLELVELTTFVAPDDVLTVAFRLDPVPEGATFDLALHPRVRNRIRFTETVTGLRLGNPLRTFGDLDAASLSRDERGVVRVDLQVVGAGAELPLAGITIPEAGVYPLSLTVFDPEGQELDRLVSHVVRLPDAGSDPDAKPLATTVVVPFEGAAALHPDGSVKLRPEEVKRLDGIVAAVGSDVPIALAPSPETLEASDLPADPFPAAEVLASTYVPMHLSSWQAQDGAATIGASIDAGSISTTGTLGSAPTSDTWLMDSTVDSAVLGTLVDRGVRKVIVAESILSPLDSGDFPVTLTQSFRLRDDRGRSVTAVQSDRALGEHLTSTGQPALAANRALSDLAVLAFDLPLASRGAVVDAGGVPDEVLDELLTGIAAAASPAGSADPLLQPVTPTDLFDHIDPAEVDDEPLERTWFWEPPLPVEELAEERAKVARTVDGYRSMIPADDDAVALALRLREVAVDRRIPSLDASLAYLDGATTVVGNRMAAVRLPEQGSVTLTSSTASIPVVIDNGLDVPVEVSLALESEKLDFPSGSPVQVTLAPGHNRIEVDVRARASGVFPVELTLSSPDGELAIGESQVRVRSAAVSGLGVVLSVGAGLFLCVWWARNWRTTRKSRALVDDAAHR